MHVVTDNDLHLYNSTTHHHYSGKFRCPYCNSNFFTEDERQMHVSREHKADIILKQYDNLSN